MTKTPVSRGGIRGPAGPGFLGTFQVRDYAADPNAAGSGLTGQDDTAALNAAMAAARAYRGVGGGKVLLDSGTWQTSAIIDQPELVTVEGLYSDTIAYAGGAASPCVVRPLATHPGTAIWRLRGKTESGRAYDHTGARLSKLTLVGDRTPSGTKGLQLVGLVREAEIDHVTVRDSKDTGIDLMVGTSAAPQSCRIKHCLVDGAGNNGLRFSNCPDTTIYDINSLGATNSGVRFEGFMNGQVSNIRAEWSGQHGVLFTSGYWGAGQGSGGCVVSNITTDRNGMNGVYIDGTCQGAGQIALSNVQLRRDGRNGGTGGGGYAGLAVGNGATMPVVVDGVTVYPGVDDDGTKTLSPQIGVFTGGTNPVEINSGYVHAATTALSVAAATVISPTIGTATGSTASPSRVAPSAVVGWPWVGANNGVAPLDSSGDVPLANLPVAASGTSSPAAVVRADDSRLTRQVEQVRANATQAITTANTWYNVLFPVEDFDDENLHSTSTNTDRITFVRPGRYRVGGSAMWTAGIAANGQRGMRLCIGGTQINGGQNLAPYLASNYCSHNVTPLFVTITQAQINAGTAYLQMQVYSSTASSNLFGSAADGCVMTAEYVGA